MLEIEVQKSIAQLQIERAIWLAQQYHVSVSLVRHGLRHHQYLRFTGPAASLAWVEARWS